ncbi:putative isoflavone 3'-hydroxylase [Helianthus debilis subsp. tardiflorus]
MLMLQFGKRRTLLVSSPAAVEECLTTNDATFANRPQLLAGKHIGYDYATITWSNYNGHWRNLRRIASLELLSAQRLHALNPIRMEEARLLVNEVHRRAMRDDGMVEMKSLLFEMMLNVVMMMIAGKRFFGDLVADVEEARRFKGIVKDTFEVMESANVTDFAVVEVGGRDRVGEEDGGVEGEKRCVYARFVRRLLKTTDQGEY